MQACSPAIGMDRVLAPRESWRFRQSCWMLLIVGAVLVPSFLGAQDRSLESLEELAIKEAVALADPSLVRIETVGGLEQSSRILFGTGPTSGVIVSADGYIISSSFNFAAKPASILVTLPDERRFPARQIAQDKQRMLTLLKIDVDGLTPAVAAPRDGVQVGAWAIALGRTYDLAAPNVSVGIVSAINRVWGKAIQTDAKLSPVNYGGPLVDIEGRVMGVNVPLSPQAAGETAGVEWYDGGIGFAIPLEDVYAVLDRLKEGKDLLPGLLGVTFKQGPMGRKDELLLDRVRFNSPAEKAGLKAGDLLVEAEGTPITRLSQLRHVLGRKYAGETLRVAVQRNDDRLTMQMTLVGELVPYEAAFLGILPQRNVTETDAVGVPVRFVFTDSPAGKAGLQAGDRILEVNEAAIGNAKQLVDLLSRQRPGDTVKLAWLHESVKSSAEIPLAAYPDSVPDQLPSPVLPPAEGAVTAKTGRFTETLAAQDREFWAYVPEKYNPATPHGLVIWIHPDGDTMEAAVYQAWKSLCDRRGLILIGPKAEKVSGWTPLEAEYVRDCVAWVRENYSIAGDRIAVHSYSSGAPFAWHLAFKHRELVRAVAMASHPLMGFVPENDPESRQQFYLTCGEDDPLFPAVKISVDILRKARFPVSFKSLNGAAHKYPGEETLDEIARWLDMLDRI